jgi:hypothetical protein
VHQAQGLEAAYSQQPELTLKALELAVRLHTAVSGDSAPRAEQLCHFCLTVLQLCKSAAGKLSTAALQPKQ